MLRGTEKANGGPGGGWGEQGTQVPLYLESPQAKYIPTYLPSACSLSLFSPSSHSPSLSLSFSQPIAPSSTSSRSPRAPLAQAIPLEVHAMMHAIEQRRGPTSGLPHLADDARRDVAVDLLLSFFFILSFSFCLSLHFVVLLCVRRVYSSC